MEGGYNYQRPTPSVKRWALPRIAHVSVGVFGNYPDSIQEAAMNTDTERKSTYAIALKQRSVASPKREGITKSVF